MCSTSEEIKSLIGAFPNSSYKGLKCPKNQYISICCKKATDPHHKKKKKYDHKMINMDKILIFDAETRPTHLLFKISTPRRDFSTDFSAVF